MSSPDRKKIAAEYYLNNKEKIKERNKEWRKNNPERAQQLLKSWRADNPDKRRLNTVRSRAKAKGVEFSLTPEDIAFPQYCPILGIKLEIGVGSGAKPNSPSIDRIDPAKGYTRDNIQVISQLANVMKNNATPGQLILFARWVLRTYQDESNL